LGLQSLNLALLVGAQNYGVFGWDPWTLLIHYR